MFRSLSTWTFRYFNSQPHEEADAMYELLEFNYVISTHSLTKRLTSKEHRKSRWSGISTHSLTKRLTKSANGYIAGPEYFNSQPHEEADRGRSRWRVGISISTHSLTKRLTNPEQVGSASTAFQLTASRRGWQEYVLIQTPFYYFNSQPHEEADLLPAYLLQLRTISFQLTASRRGWRCFCCWIWIHKYFNSQPHEEADDL